MDEHGHTTNATAPPAAPLNPIEVRVLGSLIEKEITTPEYYPLTLNALTNACCQKNNREPVVSYSETTVVRALESLRDKRLVSTVTGAGIRVPKYRHKIGEVYALDRARIALLGLLMLRGPQTVGELRTRAAPMHAFADLPEVERALDELIAYAADGVAAPLVRKLARQAGQKEVRYGHLLGGDTAPEAPKDTTRPGKAVIVVQAENERIERLERGVADLRETLADLQRQFSEFRKQFE